ncbi:GntR family transcriptional regulator [Pseudomonas denitrificans (nom. rej.)]|nr:GntR family transcriptional regulator [Pseudomonas denitrificans (nom. rej.)]
MTSQPSRISSEQRLQALRPDETLSIPLYLQLARSLETAIHAGQWRAEEALPSERHLSEYLGLSRVTARKALEVLLEQGLVHRIQGSGTFITPRLEQPLSRLSSFSEMLRLKGFTPSSTWLEREISLPTHEEVIRLGLSPTEKVVRMKRLRKADGVVMAIEQSSLPARLLGDPAVVGDSLYAHLDAIGRPVVRALQHVQAVNASVEEATLVGIRPGTAMLLMTRIGYLEDNTAIELTDTYCRNDYYDFVAELRR